MFIEEMINDQVGEATWKTPSHVAWANLHPLTDFDKREYKHVDLKDGEEVFRYENETTGRFYNPLIKVNAEKGLIYFLRNTEDDRAFFDTKGTKARVKLY